MTTLLRDLIEIPERVHADDFVLRLTQGVAHPEATLRDYVVTPELARNFDDALALIRSALEQCKGNISGAARLLGITRPQLAYRARKRGIVVQNAPVTPASLAAPRAPNAP